MPIRAMEDEKAIFTKEGDKIKFADKSPSGLIDRPILVFGGPNTGKTTIVEELLILTKNYIPNHIVIAPMTSQTPYLKKFHQKCIKEDMTKELFCKIWKRQVQITKIYNIANKLEILHGLFTRINNKQAQMLVNRTYQTAAGLKHAIESDPQLDYGNKKAQIGSIDERCDKEILKIYKSTVRRFRLQLDTTSLSQHEQIAHEFLDINPKLMIVVDDCTEKLTKWMKAFKPNEENMFQNVFFRGRHNHISMIIIAHNDKFILPDLRNAAAKIIYTDPQSFNISVGRASNGFSKEEKTLALRCSKKIFAPLPQGLKNHQKLCYIKNDYENPFQYTIAEIYPDSIISSPMLNQLAEKIQLKTTEDEEISDFAKKLLQE